MLAPGRTRSHTSFCDASMRNTHDIPPTLRSWTFTLLAASWLLAGGCKDRRTPNENAASQPASAPARQIPLDETATSSIAAEELRRHVAYLASDRLEGRGADTRGIQLAADYLEREAREIGLRPAFGSSYRQPFVMTVGARPGEKNELSQEGPRSFRIGKDFMPFTFSSTGSASGPLIFAGYGIRAKDLHYDDLEGVEVRGRVLVIYSGEPGEDDEKSPFDGKKTTRYSSLRKKLLDAREAGAAAVLVIREKLRLIGSSGSAESDTGILTHQITEATARKLLGFDPAKLRAEIDRDSKPRPRASAGKPASLTVSIVRDRRPVDNVGALFVPKGATGSDVVVIGAHYDHLGHGSSSSLSGSEQPEIHNGADDNASGSAVVLEVARALVQHPEGLKKKVLFTWFAGEESGLLGSGHLVRNPPLPLETMVAMINLDMVGQLRGNRLHVLGVDSGAELRDLATRAVARRKLTGVFGGDAYGPSDHTSFYARGVPVLFLFTGAHEHYHRPSDDIETLNYPGMAEVAAVAADLVRALAASDQRPTHVQLAAPPPSSGRGYGPYFGSIPDFAESTQGVPLSGVRKGSPADRAGVRAGDVIVRFNGVRTQSLQDFTQVLRDLAPGDEVEVEVLRGGETVKTRATLEKREDRGE